LDETFGSAQAFLELLIVQRLGFSTAWPLARWRGYGLPIAAHCLILSGARPSPQRNAATLLYVWCLTYRARNGRTEVLISPVGLVRKMASQLGSLGTSPMIAIVDDDKGTREALEMLVRSLGHNAFQFGSAEDFLESEKLRDTSCLITDVQMPGLTGLNLQDRLIADGHRIPIIFITGHPDDNARAA
jgi:hypothetical protein